MTAEMIIRRLRSVSRDLRMDVGEYATQMHIMRDIVDDVRKSMCAEMCDLIADELEEEEREKEAHRLSREDKKTAKMYEQEWNARNIGIAYDEEDTRSKYYKGLVVDESVAGK